MGNCTKPQSLSEPEDGEIALARCHLILKASTWQRDSHELFDYESPNLRRKILDIQSACSLVKEGADEIGMVALPEVIKNNKKVLSSGIIKYEEKDLIEPALHVNVNRGGFYSIFDRVH